MAAVTDTTTTRRPAASRRSPGTRPRRQRGVTLLPVLLVTPAVVLLAVFTLAPAVYAVGLSFFQLKVSGGLLGTGTPHDVFAGLSNYIETLADSEFWASLGRMLLIAAIGVPSTILLSTLFALCLDAKNARLVGFSRLAIFLPYAVPGVVASLLWGFIYLPATSPIGGNVVDYFGSTTIFFSVANVAVWGVVGFNMIITYTALRSLPAELFEAAELDGASELQIALRIKLPMIAPAITMVALFSVIGALQLFNEPATLKPLANAISSTWVPLMRVYADALGNNNVNSGAAASFILIILTVGASLVVNFIGRAVNRKENS